MSQNHNRINSKSYILQIDQYGQQHWSKIPLKSPQKFQNKKKKKILISEQHVSNANQLNQFFNKVRSLQKRIKCLEKQNSKKQKKINNLQKQIGLLNQSRAKKENRFLQVLGKCKSSVKSNNESQKFFLRKNKSINNLQNHQELKVIKSEKHLEKQNHSLLKKKKISRNMTQGLKEEEAMLIQKLNLQKRIKQHMHVTESRVNSIDNNQIKNEHPFIYCNPTNSLTITDTPTNSICMPLNEKTIRAKLIETFSREVSQRNISERDMKEETSDSCKMSFFKHNDQSKVEEKLACIPLLNSYQETDQNKKTRSQWNQSEKITYRYSTNESTAAPIINGEKIDLPIPVVKEKDIVSQTSLEFHLQQEFIENKNLLIQSQHPTKINQQQFYGYKK